MFTPRTTVGGCTTIGSNNYIGIKGLVHGDYVDKYKALKFTRRIRIQIQCRYLRVSLLFKVHGLPVKGPMLSYFGEYKRETPVMMRWKMSKSGEFQGSLTKIRKYLAVLLVLTVFAVVPAIVYPLRGEVYFNGKFVVTFCVAAMSVLVVEYKIKEQHLWVTGFVFLTGMSFLFSVSQRLSLIGPSKNPEGIVPLLVCYMMLILGSNFNLHEVIESKYTRIVVELMLISASLISLIGFLEFFGVIGPLSYKMKVWVGAMSNFTTIGNRNLVGAYTVLMIPISFWWTVHYRKIRGFLYSMGIVSLMVISQTRSAYVAFVVIMTAFILMTFNNRDERKWDAFLIVSVCIYVIGGVYLLSSVLNDSRILDRLQKLYLDLLNPISDSAGSDRMLIWRNTLSFAFDRPLFGFGPDTFGMIYDEKIGIHWNTFPKAHNHWLQMGVTLGLPYLILYLGMLLRLTIKLIRDRSEIAFVLLLIMVVYELQGMFNISGGPYNYMYWVILGLSFGLEAGSKISVKRRTKHFNYDVMR